MAYMDPMGDTPMILDTMKNLVKSHDIPFFWNSFLKLLSAAVEVLAEVSTSTAE